MLLKWLLWWSLNWRDCSIGALESSFCFFGVSTGVDPFVAAFSTLEINWCCSSDEHLYAQTLSILHVWCPVLSMISCSSAPLWNNLVVFVTLREWFVLNPVISAVSQRRFTVFDSVLWPTGTLEYHVIPFGFFNVLTNHCILHHCHHVQYPCHSSSFHCICNDVFRYRMEMSLWWFAAIASCTP